MVVEMAVGGTQCVAPEMGKKCAEIAQEIRATAELLGAGPDGSDERWSMAERIVWRLRDRAASAPARAECARSKQATETPQPTGRSFGWALERLKEGKRVARAGWNGKGMYLWLLPPAEVKAEWCMKSYLEALAEAQGGKIAMLASICMLTADKKVLTGWLASQTDMLAEDWWEVVEG